MSSSDGEFVGAAFELLLSRSIGPVADLRYGTRNTRLFVTGKAVLLLVSRHALTVYDAAYLELAKRKGLPLATQDSDLLQAAPLENVLLIVQP